MYRQKKLYALVVFLIIAIALLSGTVAAAEDEPAFVYVKASDSPADAWADIDSELVYDDLQDAMDAAFFKKATVLVAVGTYEPKQDIESAERYSNEGMNFYVYPTNPGTKAYCFAIPNGVTVIGGFKGDEAGTIPTYPKGAGEKTVISGENTGSYNLFVQTANAFHIKTANPDAPKQVVTYTGNGATLDNVTVTGGNANLDKGYRSKRNEYGGAMYIDMTVSMNIKNCIFENNNAKTQGGAIYYNHTAKPAGGYVPAYFSNCDFIDNTCASGGLGSAVYNDVMDLGTLTYTGPRIEYDNCTFSGNTGGAQVANYVGGKVKYATVPLVAYYFCEFTSAGNTTMIRNLRGSTLYVNSKFVTDSGTPYTISSQYARDIFANCLFEGSKLYPGGECQIEMLNCLLESDRFMFYAVNADNKISMVNCTVDIGEANLFDNKFNNASLDCTNTLIKATEEVTASDGGTIRSSIINDTLYDEDGVASTPDFDWDELLDTEYQIDGEDADLAVDAGDDEAFEDAFEEIYGYIAPTGRLPVALDLMGNERIFGDYIDLGAHESESDPVLSELLAPPVVMANIDSGFNHQYLSDTPINKNIILSSAAGRVAVIPGIPGVYAKDINVVYRLAGESDFTDYSGAIIVSDYAEYEFFTELDGERSEPTEFIANINKTAATVTVKLTGIRRGYFPAKGTINLIFSRPTGYKPGLDTHFVIGTLEDLTDATPAVQVFYEVGKHDIITLNENGSLGLEKDHRYRLTIHTLHDEHGNPVDIPVQEFTVGTPPSRDSDSDGGSSGTTTTPGDKITAPTSDKGWTDAAETVNDLNDGESFTVDMEDNSVVSGDFLEAVAGKDVDLTFDMGDGMSWTVNGMDIPTGTDFSDINLGVSIGTNFVPVEVRNIDGSISEVQLQLAHNGEFDFELTLSVTLDTRNAGYFANLYYYNEATGELEFMSAVRVGADGSADFVFGHASDYLIVVAEESLAPEPEAPWQNPFTDVKASDWFYGDVQYAVENGLFAGTSAATFSPDTLMTRAMLVTVLGRMAGIDPADYAVPSFDDTPAGTYYTPYVSWAAQNGIVTGYNEGSFGPDDVITRQDVAVVLTRYMQYAEINVPVTQDYRFFADEEQIADYAKGAIQLMNKLGIINGVGESTINPTGSATRAEVAAMLHRFLEIKA